MSTFNDNLFFNIIYGFSVLVNNNKLKIKILICYKQFNIHAKMSCILTCQNCGESCSKVLGRSNVHYSTTQYDGVLCSNGCSIIWITKMTMAKKKPKKISQYDGTIKIVYTKRCSNAKI